MSCGRIALFHRSRCSGHLLAALPDPGAPRDAETPLQAVHAGGDAAGGVVRGGQQDAGAQQLQVQLRGGGPRHLVERLVGDVRGAGELCGAQLGGLVAQAVDLVRGHTVQDVGGRIRDGVDHHEVPEALEEVLHEAARVLPGLDHAVHGGEHRGGVPGGEGVNDVVQQSRVGVAEQGDREVVGEPALVRARHELVQDGQRVAHGPAAGAHHQGEHTGFGGDTLLLAQLLQVAHERLGRHQPEGVVVRAGADGGEHLGGFRGGEDELHVLRRFLHDFQQRIEALARDHVGLVDDEDLVAVAHGRKGGAFAQVTRVVHAAVGGGVHLDDVQ